MAERSCYIEFVGGNLVEVFDWLVNANCPYEYRATDFPLDAVNKLQEVINRQEVEIEAMLVRTGALEDELGTAINRAEHAEEQVEELLTPSSRRPPPHFKLPDERPSAVYKFQVGTTSLGKGYLIVGTYPGSKEVGELFIKMSAAPHVDLVRADSTREELIAVINELKAQVSDLTYFLHGILDQLAIAVSIGLQRGIPLQVFIEKFKHTRFPPEGWTQNPVIGHCSSILDYVFRWLSFKYLEENKAGDS